MSGPARVLVAGLGNIFFGDDAFGVAVAQRLAEQGVPEGMRVADFGIRGIHLAYELLEETYELTVLADATARGGAPGTLYVIEPELGRTAAAAAPAVADAHGMSPDQVFAWLTKLGGRPGRVVVVGCEPARIDEGIGLSAPVANAVAEAVRLILDLVQRERPLATGGRAATREESA